MKRSSQAITFFFKCCWIFRVIDAYGLIPPTQPILDTSPWIPVPKPKYLFGPPPGRLYGMPLSPRDQSPRNPYLTAIVPDTGSQQLPEQPVAPVSQWESIPAVSQEISPSVWQVPTQETALKPSALDALPSSSGKLPLVPLIFRNPSAGKPDVKPATDPAPEGMWPSAPVPDGVLSSVSDPSPQTAPVPGLASDSNAGQITEELAPPGTFWPIADSTQSDSSNSSATWPDTPKEVPAASLLRPPLGTLTFGGSEVPPAK